MSTTFYIRTVNVSLPTIGDSCSSSKSELDYVVFKNLGVPANGKLALSSGIFNVFQENSLANEAYGYPGPRLYVPCETGNASVISTPTKNSYGDGGYAKYLFPTITNYRPINGDIIYSDTLPLDNLDISEAGWANRGWTPSNLDTFRTEICTYIQNIKTYHGFDYDYDNDPSNHLFKYDFGDDRGTINMTLFEVTFVNDPTPGRKYYDFVFFHGNDPECDYTLTI